MKTRYEQLTRVIHPTSIVCAVALDVAWAVLEIGLGVSLVGLPLAPVCVAILFVVCMLVVTLIQRHGARDSWVSALGKGFVVGAVAAVPLFFASALGVAALAVMRGVPYHDADRLPPGTFGGAPGGASKPVGTDVQPNGAEDGDAAMLGTYVIAWNQFEEIVNELVPPAHRREDVAVKLQLLRNLGVLSPSQFNRATQFRVLRNSLTHAGSDRKLTLHDTTGLETLNAELANHRT
jgi:hypothetical protein